MTSGNGFGLFPDEAGEPPTRTPLRAVSTASIETMRSISNPPFGSRSPPDYVRRSKAQPLLRPRGDPGFPRREQAANWPRWRAGGRLGQCARVSLELGART